MIRLISTILMVGALAGRATAGDVPDVVLQYADAFSQSQTTEERLPSGRTLRDEYAASFFQGFTHPYGATATRPDLWNDAYTHGQTYWRDHPFEREGWTMTISTGNTAIGFSTRRAARTSCGIGILSVPRDSAMIAAGVRAATWG